MRYRQVRMSVVVLALAVGWAGFATAQDTLPSGSTALDVLLTVAPSLPETARATMIEEATAIWRRQNVMLDWLPGGTIRKSSSPMLRLLVVPKKRPGGNENTTLVVAELLRPDKGRPLAIASIETAERIVRDSALQSKKPAAPDPYRVGLVLGRAVAHEIGHFLLDTRTHSPSGLMRARFDMQEFADPKSRAFLLDPDSALGLTDRILRDARTTAVTPLREAVGVSPSP